MKLTRKVREARPSLRIREVLALGTEEWIIQDRDCHMLRLSESPTNIIFFPRHFSRKLAPLNLEHPQSENSTRERGRDR